ncbi:MAG: hypothetical protein ACE5HP_10495 [Gemmatimonadota bacterium]
MLPRPKGLISPARSLRTAAALILLVAPGATAQQERIDSPYRWAPGALRVGLVGGYFDSSRGSFDFGPGPTAVVGGRFRARISSPLTIELGTLIGDSRRFVIDPRLAEGPAPVDTVSTTWGLLQFGLQLSLTGSRTWHRVQPFLLFGTGLMFGLREERSEIFAEPELEGFRYNLGTAPLFQAGLGTEIRASRRLGIGLEARDYLIRLKAPDGFFLPEVLDTIEEAGAPAPRDTQWPSNVEFSVSLWYYL